MKFKLFTSLFLAFALFSSSCKSSKIQSGEVNFISSPEQGTILVSAAGYGAQKSTAVTNAETNAFHTLIFHGVPGSQYNLPMLPNKEQARKKHQSYLDKLLKEGGYHNFMMLSEEETKYHFSGKNQKNILMKVKINVSALRRDMENNGVVRKFGL